MPALRIIETTRHAWGVQLQVPRVRSAVSVRSVAARKATKAHRLVYTRHRQAVQEAINRGWLAESMESIEARAKEMANE